MQDCTINLLKRQIERDSYGVERETITSREVFAQKASVTRSEFFGAGRSGLNPELVFSVFHADYDGENIIEYDGKRYAVYRTYLNDSDYIELYTQREGGTNGGS